MKIKECRDCKDPCQLRNICADWKRRQKQARDEVEDDGFVTIYPKMGSLQ